MDALKIVRVSKVPDVVHVMMDGKVVLSGGPELAVRLEKEGYAKLAEELGFTYTEEA